MHTHAPWPSPGLQPWFGCVQMYTYTFSAIEPEPNIEMIAETVKNEHIGENQPENKCMTPLP